MYASCVRGLIEDTTSSQQKELAQAGVLSPEAANMAKRNISADINLVDQMKGRVSKLKKSHPMPTDHSFTDWQKLLGSIEGGLVCLGGTGRNRKQRQNENTQKEG